MKIIRYRYNNLILILYRDLNIKKEYIKNKLGKNIELFDYEIIFNNDVNIFTRIQLNKDKEKKSYLNYFIVYDIKNYSFNLLNKLVQINHRAININIVKEDNIKLDRAKEVIELYITTSYRIEYITKRLYDVFNWRNSWS